MYTVCAVCLKAEEDGPLGLNVLFLVVLLPV